MNTPTSVRPEAEWGRTLTDAQRHAVRDVLTDLASRDDILGVVLAGSIVRGEGGPTSDLDIYVVVSSPWRQRRQLLLEGVPVEVFINPPWTIRSYFAEETSRGRPSTAHMLATGVVLYAPSPALDELRDEARRILAQGPPALSEADLTQRRYGVIDLSDDADDLRAGDPDALAYVLPQMVEQAVALLYARARRWQPKPKRLLADLAQFDPEAATLLRRYLRHADLPARHALARTLVERSIAPQPVRFFAWDSSPGHVPPPMPQRGRRPRRRSDR